MPWLGGGGRRRGTAHRPARLANGSDATSLLTTSSAAALAGVGRELQGATWREGQQNEGGLKNGTRRYPPAVNKGIGFALAEGVFVGRKAANRGAGVG